MTLYEVLGVDPTASPEELHRAYRDRARVLHPDHRGGADDAAMQDLNAAWAVLSDPARRREYDGSLAPPSVLSPPPVRSDAAGSGEEDQIVDGADGVTTLVRAVPLIVLLLVLAAIFVFTAFALSGPDEPASPSSDPAVGSCVKLRAGHVSEIVACGVPNDGRVAHIVDRSQPCPPGEQRADGRDGSSALCLTIA